MIDINELRRLAQAANAEPDGDVMAWIEGMQRLQGALLPDDVIELIGRLEAAEKERDFAKVEIARLHDDIHELTDERDTYKAAYNEWAAKTEWVQDELTSGKLPAKYLGMHRADGIKVEIDALRAKIEAMEKQEPVGEIQRANSTGNYICSEVWVPLPVRAKLYALPGAQPVPSVPDGWKLVPIVSTDEMDNAGSNHCDGCLSTAQAVWDAMLAAAPEARP